MACFGMEGFWEDVFTPPPPKNIRIELQGDYSTSPLGRNHSQMAHIPLKNYGTCTYEIPSSQIITLTISNGYLFYLAH